MPASLPEKMISFVEAASAMAEKAASDEKARLDREKRAEALIPGIVDTLSGITVRINGTTEPLLQPDEKVACASALGDHVMALGILQKVAQQFKSAQADRIGQGQEKDPSTGRQEKQGAYTGRRGSLEPPSFENFRRAILGG
jgi:hypothetical protein